MKIFKFLQVNLIVFCMAVLSITTCFAQDVSVDAYINTKNIELAGAAQLTITVHGTEDAVPIAIPDVDGFDVRSLGASTSHININGNRSVSVTYTYSLFALKVGSFQIPQFSINVKGQSFPIGPIDLEVVNTQANSITGEASKSSTIADKLYLKVELERNKYYLGEAIPVKIILYVSDVPVTDIQYPVVEVPGLTFGEMQKPNQYQDIIQGVRFNIVEFKTIAYPTRLGKIDMGPFEMGANLIVRDNSSNRGSSRDSFFNDDFFDSFFTRTQKRPFSIKSDSKTIEVLELPAEGQPKSFTGAVGKFSFEASISPKEITLGDPLTLKMRLSGIGNLDSIKFPSFSDLGNFKLYDPSIKVENDAKILEQVVIPKSENVSRIPAIEFSYFDPTEQKYKQIQKGPFDIVVTKSSSDQGLKIVDYNEMQARVQDVPEEIGHDIVYIKENLGDLYTKGKHFYSSVTFFVLLFCYIVIWGFLYFMVLNQSRLQTDKVYANKITAPKYARAGLAKAKGYLELGKSKDFYDEIFKTLQKYLTHKLHIKAGNFDFKSVNQSLELKGVDSYLLNELKSILETCEMIRYASLNIDKVKMVQVFETIEKIIDNVERRVR